MGALSCGWGGAHAPSICSANASVRIRRPKICKLACKAQGARIFAKGEYPADDIENKMISADRFPLAIFTALCYNKH